MCEVGNQKDLLSWLQEDFTPAIIAARKALEPHVKKCLEIATVLNQALTRFIEEHKETIELWVRFAEIYPILKPYIDNISESLSDPDFEVANDVIEYAHIFGAIDLEKSPEAITLMSIISTEIFQKSVSDFYLNSSLDIKRLPLIQEAMLLHNLGYYGGSICLLYGLIEGVLTESFEKAKYIIRISGHTSPIKPDGTTNSKHKLTGLVQKLDHAISNHDHLDSYYDRIKSYELVNGKPDQTIPKTRNSILHGESVDFNTEKRSAQLIMWLYSALLHVDALGFNNSIKPTQHGGEA